MESIQPDIVVKPPRRWPLFVAGLLLFFLGPAIYMGQMSMGQTFMPWYLPILATVGVLLMALASWRRGKVLLKIVTFFFFLLAGLVWYGLVEGTKTPPYTGPAQVGKPIPAFETTLADSRRFTNDDVGKDEATVLLFFRGHW